MTQSLEERNAALEEKNKQLLAHYQTAYQENQQLRSAASHYKGQVELLQAKPQREEAEEPEHDEPTGLDAKSLEAIMEKLLDKRLKPIEDRVTSTHAHSLNALQQATGRVVDEALAKFKRSHPEHDDIFDFDRNVTTRARAKLDSLAQSGEQQELVDVIISEAKGIVKEHGERKVHKEKINRERSEAAASKAKVPEYLQEHGIDELPNPKTETEMLDLVDKLAATGRFNAQAA